MKHFCRVSKKPLTITNDFGKQPLGNGFLDNKKKNSEYFYHMKTGFCEESKMFQLAKQPAPKKMFHKDYAFFSGTSKSMTKHFENFYNSVINSRYCPSNPFIVELGCNDGILIKNFKNNNYKHLGVEPSRNVANFSKKIGINIMNDFFNSKSSKKIEKKNGKADFILAANVMCHIPNIVETSKAIESLLSQNGVLIFEEPYLGDVIRKNSYDQIYDEHVFLFSGLSVENLFNKVDMEIVDLIPQITHGGSMRYVVAKKNRYIKTENVKKILNKEIKQGLDKTSTFKKFDINIKKSKKKFLKLLLKLKKQNKRISGYAATSKSTTILNYCGIDKKLIDCIYDTTPNKIGKLTPGMHIPVKNYKLFNKDYPDYAVLFAWNHSIEILKKEKEFSKKGKKWIFFVPKIIIG